MIALKTLLFTVLVPGTVTILIPYTLLSPDYTTLDLGVVRYLGPLFLLLGILLYAWCAWHFTFSGRGTPAPIDPPKELVVQGPYRRVRNPMYLAVLAVLLGEAFLFEARSLFIYLLGVCVTFALVVRVYEEPTLRRQYGDAYQRYCADVPRWMPGMRVFRPQRPKR